MLVIIRIDFTPSATPLRVQRKAATATGFVNGIAADASCKKTADAGELLSRSSAFLANKRGTVVEKEATVKAKPPIEGKTTVIENETGRRFAEK